MSRPTRPTIQADRDQQLLGFVSRRTPRQPLATIAQANEHIFKRRETQERPNELECPSQAAATNPMGGKTGRALTEEMDLTFIGDKRPADEIEQGSFP
jgi:hypothetical protein